MEDKIDFTLPDFSAKIIEMWECHVDESTKGRYNMILGRDILTELGLSLKFSEHVTIWGDGPLKCSASPMVDFVTYKFKVLNTGKTTTDESFINAHI